MINNQSSDDAAPNGHSDEELLPALKQQDERAISYIYRRYWPMVLQLVKLNSGNEEDAKDLYQESILDFLEKLWSGKLVLTCKIKTFIYSICRNKWYHQLRGKKTFVDVEAYVAVEKSTFEESQQIKSMPDSEQIEMAITALGEPCHSIIIGYYYAGLSMEELAEKLNYKSANVAKQQKLRCKERLKQALQKYLKSS